MALSLQYSDVGDKIIERGTKYFSKFVGVRETSFFFCGPLTDEDAVKFAGHFVQR